jgi:molybdopterin-containing oxidoreductase family membrane subunit
MRTRWIAWVGGVAVVGLLAGAWGLLDYLRYGHSHTHYGSYVPWGLWVAMYLFFVGISAGAFMFATLDFLFGMRLFKGTGRVALWGALVSLGAGLLSIWLDLGHLERIWRVYLHPNWFSVMAQMVWGYSLFGLVGAVALVLTKRAPRSIWMKPVMVIGLVLSVFLSGGVGALIGVQAARPYWHVGLFPAQFPVFSLASGAAFLLVAVGLFGDADDPRRPQQLHVLSLVTVVLQGVKLYFLWADFSQSLYGGIPMNVQAVREVMFGPYWWAFWLLQLVAGTAIPLMVLTQSRLARHPGWAGWMGVLVLIGFAVARANIIFPALTVPELEALRSAFAHPRLSFAYFPSLTEWLVQVWIVSLGTLVFLAGLRWVPFVRSKEESAHG